MPQEKLTNAERIKKIQSEVKASDRSLVMTYNKDKTQYEIRDKALNELLASSTRIDGLHYLPTIEFAGTKKPVIFEFPGGAEGERAGYPRVLIKNNSDNLVQLEGNVRVELLKGKSDFAIASGNPVNFIESIKPYKIGKETKSSLNKPTSGPRENKVMFEPNYDKDKKSPYTNVMLSGGTLHIGEMNILHEMTKGYLTLNDKYDGNRGKIIALVEQAGAIKRGKSPEFEGIFEGKVVELKAELKMPDKKDPDGKPAGNKAAYQEILDEIKNKPFKPPVGKALPIMEELGKAKYPGAKAMVKAHQDFDEAVNAENFVEANAKKALGSLLNEMEKAGKNLQADKARQITADLHKKVKALATKNKLVSQATDLDPNMDRAVAQFMQERADGTPLGGEGGVQATPVVSNGRNSGRDF